MATQFGGRIRELRTKQHLLLRQLASMLEVDASIVSKIELGERRAKKEQVVQLAGILNTNKDELLTLWLADQVYDIVKDEHVQLTPVEIGQRGPLTVEILHGLNRGDTVITSNLLRLTPDARIRFASLK